MKTLKRTKRRHVALLEVLIAFALVALCALPLIYPHVFILRSEKKFISTVELDHVVNLLYADLLQKLYQNEISWQDIENGKEISIEDSSLEAIHQKEKLLFNGTYKFTKIRQKPPAPAENTAYLLSLEFNFKIKPGFFLEKDLKDKTPVITYKYLIPLERNFK